MIQPRLRVLDDAFRAQGRAEARRDEVDLMISAGNLRGRRWREKNCLINQFGSWPSQHIHKKELADDDHG